MRARFVVEAILNELEARDSDGVERLVIGAARVAVGDGGDAQVFQRLDPLRKDRADGGVFLQLNAEDFAGAVIDVEVAGNFRLLGLQHDWAASLTHPLRFLQLFGSGRERRVAEMLLHVASGTK